MPSATPSDRTDFDDFYNGVFLREHTHPANIALHVAGTLASAALVPAAAIMGNAWWLLLYPLVHVAPGLIGHRLFERDAALGDVRVTRSDYPLRWFIIANHRMTWAILLNWKLPRARTETTE